MARPREFDRDEALKAGRDVFWRQGFAATTTDDLRLAMGIGRQSFYGAFGDKKRCYLEALQAYVTEEVTSYVAALRRSASPLQGLYTLLAAASGWDDERRARGCMALNAVAEFGWGDAEVTAALTPGAMVLRQGIVSLLIEAKDNGEAPASLDEQAAAGALMCMRSGILVGARGGMSAEVLRGVAAFAVDSVRHAAPTASRPSPS